MKSHHESEQTLCAKLGLIGRNACTLNDASATIVNVFEEHGYDIRTFKTHPAHHVELQCSHYSIDLRHRRSIAPARMPDGSPCKSHLHVTLTPHFPQAVDREISEILLVMCLKGLVNTLTDTAAVFWLNAPHPLSPDEFLSVFETERDAPATLQSDTVDPYMVINSNTADAGKAVPEISSIHEAVDKYFEPIEKNLNNLEHHCNQLIASLAPARATEVSKSTAPNTRAALGFVKYDHNREVTTLFKIARSITTFKLLRFGWRPRSMSIQILMFVVALSLFDLSTGVQAALN